MRKIKIYLGDLDYFKEGNRISVPLGIGSISSYCAHKFGDAVDIEVFKDPEELMARVHSDPPDILGLSYYLWNERLSMKVFELVKKDLPAVVTVCGGPSVARLTDRYRDLLETGFVDVVALDIGERAFANVVGKVLSGGSARENLFSGPIGGCAVRLHGSGEIIRGGEERSMEGFDSLPSPYLDGTLDRFIKQDMLLTFETVRGCPYRCAFCSGGTGRTSTSMPGPLRVKPDELVNEELEFLRKNAKSRELDLIDTNFGIMGERDLRIARRMVKMYKASRFPYIVGFATSKNKDEVAVEMMRIFAQITGKIYFAIQTFSENVLDNCHRKNMPVAMVRALADEAKKNSWGVKVDLIFGLPGETVESFYSTCSTLAEMGIDRPEIYQLRLLPGTELAEKGGELYGYRTKKRFFNNRFNDLKLGRRGEKFRLVETEDIVCSSKDFGFEDYLRVRSYSFFTMLLSYSAFNDTVGFLVKRGVSLTDVILDIQKHAPEFEDLGRMLKDYVSYSSAELMDAEQVEGILKDDAKWSDLLNSNGEFFKINLGFIGYCLLENTRVLQDIAAILSDRSGARLSGTDREKLKVILEHDRRCRVFPNYKDRDLRSDRPVPECEYELDHSYETWRDNGYSGVLSDYPASRKTHVYYIDKHEALREYLEKFSALSGYHFYERLLVWGPADSLRRKLRLRTDDASGSASN